MPPSRTRFRSRSVTVTVAVAIAVAVLGPVAQPAAAAPATLPLTVANHSGRGSVHLYVIGVDLSSNRLGYVDAGGTFHPWSLPGSGAPVTAPDVSVDGPSEGGSTTLKIPRNVSGRVYFSYGKKLTFQLVSGGLVQPAPWNPSDPNADILFDWSEFTYTDSGLWINSSQVDQFAAPHEVSATGSDGVTRSTGATVAGGRQQIIDGVAALPGYQKTVVTGSDGTVLRVLAPGKATDLGLMSRTYLDPAIDKAWQTYASKTLTIEPYGAGLASYRGRTQGGRLVFTDTAGQQVASFAKPSTEDVWDCDGALAAPNDATVGPIARTLCAALHRGNLATQAVQPGGPSAVATFYRSEPANLYAKVIQAHMADGKAYGFAFDDVLEQESLVHSPSPVSAGMVLEPLGSGAVPDGAEPVDPSPGPAESEPAEPEDIVTTGDESTVTLTADHPGYATLVLGEGTAPGLVTVAVDGGSTSTVAVSGPTTTRVDLSGSAGVHAVTITSTGALGSARLELP